MRAIKIGDILPKKSQCYTLYSVSGVSPTITSGNSRYGGLSPYILIIDMKKKRDFHKEVRVIYRACRRIYGKEKTQDECLRVFKIVFPELYKLKKSDRQMASVPMDVRNALYALIREWKPKNRLRDLIDKVESFFDLPFEYDREQLIKFYEDILPVVMRIRKLTPRECFRLMDVEEEDIDTIQSSGVSNSAQYKLAGNSICVCVLYHLFRKLLIDRDVDTVKGQPVQLSLF